MSWSFCAFKLCNKIKNVRILLQKIKHYSNKPPSRKNKYGASTLRTKGKFIIYVVFGKYLLVTNTVLSGLMMGMGDLLQQEIEIYQGKLKYRYDIERIERLYIVGILQGPFQHYFYKHLDRILPQRNAKTIAKKIFFDQIIASPICIAIFFIGTGYLEFKSLEECFDELRSKFLQVYFIDCHFWPVTQIINFRYVPNRFRVFYVLNMTLLYDIYLSSVKHQDTHQTHTHNHAHDKTPK